MYRSTRNPLLYIVASAALMLALGACSSNDKISGPVDPPDPPDPTGWASGTPLKPQAAADVDDTTITVARTARTAADGSSTSDRLAITEDGVTYADGKSVIQEGVGGTTDELPLRGITIREAVVVQGHDGAEITSSDGTLKSSIQLTEGGAVLKVGGDVVSYDMLRRFSGADPSWWAPIGADGDPDDNSDRCWDGGVQCGNWIHDDLTINFDGSPSQAPDGSAAWYWKGRVPLPEGANADEVLADKAQKDLGQYELWLSNYAGVDQRGTPEDETDDEYSYLSYAAYGLFNYLDNVVQLEAITRAQAFHFGYDAFPNTDNIAQRINGTFTGRTFGHILKTRTNPDGAGYAGGRAPSDEVDRLRGDITLRASVGNDRSLNTILGDITNLQSDVTGEWADVTDLDAIRLRAGVIGSDGTYRGGAQAQKGSVVGSGTGYYDGNFEGAFYGPANGLETAGWWNLGPDYTTFPDTSDLKRAIGSFGAVCTSGCPTE